MLIRAIVLKPWQISLSFHVGVLAFFLILLYFSKMQSEPVVIQDFVVPINVQNLNKEEEKPKVILKSINEEKPSTAAEKPREIFGANRNSLTDSSQEIASKKGNTITKDVDSKVLTDADASQLPNPTDEYLVSEMPQVITEVRPTYPAEARAKQIEGSVALNVLIDNQGVVRQVTFIEGPEIFRGGALEAMKKFRFKPAFVTGQPVAVRIRYVLKFKLEF